MRVRSYCHDCRRAYHDIRAHYQTQKHLRNVVSSTASDPPECSICMERREEFVQCVQCVYVWCTDCNHSLNRCPYCRLEPPPRRIRSLLHQMDRWRRRNVRELSHLPPLMVRMSWDEVRFLTTLMMQH